MSYAPNNVLVYDAAFAGAIAGIVAHNRFIQSTVASSYAGTVAACGAYAQEFDTAWGVTAADTFQLQSISEVSKAFWSNRFLQSTVPGFYSRDVDAMIELIVAGENYLAGQAIVPPPWPAPGASGLDLIVRAVDASIVVPGTAANFYIGLSGLTANRAVTLPAGNAGQRVRVKDEDGSLATFSITVSGASNIDQSASYVMNGGLGTRACSTFEFVAPAYGWAVI